VERLPFALTDGQEAALAEIDADLDEGDEGDADPMARLLQGDVGAGKTLVAFMAALRVIERGGQAVLMAPTELLARQHADNAYGLLGPLGVNVAFLSGNVKAQGRANLLAALKAGEIDLLCGTHALFSKDVEYHNLRLAVIDEQHRFGVLQREAITAKASSRPHTLMMSATPIPRSLALTVYGDLDVSVIRGLPPGRKPIETRLCRYGHEQVAYDAVRAELAKGRQAYFVYPLIEKPDDPDSAAADLRDAQSMSQYLAEQEFPGYPLALLHSRVPDEEKRRIMEDFRAGKIRILAATSVIEVGVDVPNATCMVIEHAERFGLSALHQLRGRVGRGGEQSWCWLLYRQDIPAEYKGLDTARLNEEATALSDEQRSTLGRRLKVMMESRDGFYIAEKDLELRGPGQITGLAQSGDLSLHIARPARDVKLLLKAREAAFALLADDPALEKPENHVVAEVLRRVPPAGAGVGAGL
jgi:ATP-dependent DNA helicase RecG